MAVLLEMIAALTDFDASHVSDNAYTDIASQSASLCSSGFSSLYRMTIS